MLGYLSFLTQGHSVSHAKFKGYSYKDASQQYAIMLDAGSTSTKLNVFTWTTISNTGVPNIESAPPGSSEPWSLKSAAMSSFVDSPTDAGESLKPLLDFVRNKLENETGLDYGKIPVYLRATAGKTPINNP